LRSRIDASRIAPTPEEKAELMRWGAAFDHKIDGVMEVVKPATYRKWIRQMKKRIPFKRSGRPRIPECVRRIVRRMAIENVLWGYERIVGELRKIGCRIGRTSVQRILKDEGIHPLPGKARKRPPLRWITFVHAHMETLLACDFFSLSASRSGRFAERNRPMCWSSSTSVHARRSPRRRPFTPMVTG